MSARETDLNGYILIRNNPITKTGVFPYLARDIFKELPPNVSSDQIIYVYRPAEELAKQETINSFKLVPLINDHEMLGVGDGFTPPEQKGVHGFTGEDVYFDGKYLLSSLRILSSSLNSAIDSGKVELSAGYRAKYEFSSGVYEGQNYQAIQRDIYANHIALVDEGRSGPDVAVLDSFLITLDAKDLTMHIKALDAKPGVAEMQLQALDAEPGVAEVAPEMSLKDIVEALKAMAPQLQELMSFMGKLKPLEEVEHNVELDQEESLDEEVSDEEETAKENLDEEVKDGDEEKSAMDTALKKEIKSLRKEMAKLKQRPTLDSSAMLKEIAERNELAQKVSQYVGTFDHAAMTTEQVARYGVKKLGLECKQGEEFAVLRGFFHHRKPEASAFGIVADAKAANQQDSEAALLTKIFGQA